MEQDPKYLKQLTEAPRAIPGQSLTADPDNPRPFESPPQFVSLHEASEYIFGNLLDEETYVQLMGELMNGRTVMEIVQVVTFSGFAKGLWTPDLMLLLGEPVAYMILALAERAGIEKKIYDGEEDDDEDDEDGVVAENQEVQLKALQRRSKQFTTMPTGGKLTDELKQKVNALPMKEEIESMITKPEASPESLLDPTEEQ